MSKQIKNNVYYEVVYGVEIEYPATPSPHQIINYGLPHNKQKFQRTTVPDSFKRIERDENGKPIWNNEQKEFILQEGKRRILGCWYYIKGEPTFIPPDMYFELNYCKLPDGKFKEYRDTDRRTHLYCWNAENNDNCYGVLILKQRRRGLTTTGNAKHLNRITTRKGVQGGIQSKVDEDAESVFNELVDMFLELPEFFQPIRETAGRPAKSLRFFEPSSREAKAQKTREQNALKSYIDFRATTFNAYDGRKLAFYHGNEFGKLKNISLNKLWSVVKECLSVGRKINGFAFLESTSEEAKLGGAEWKNVWSQSDPLVLNANGQTNSGLWRLFCPAYDGLEGFIGEFGESIIDTPTPEQAQYLKSIDKKHPCIGSKEYLMNKRQSYIEIGNFEGLAEEKRKYPFVENDALSSGAGVCIFNQEIIEIQLNKVLSMEVSGQINSTIARGNFIWADGVGSKVKWHPDKSGRWAFSYIPDDDSLNTFTTKQNKRVPINHTKFVIGTDPIDSDVIKDESRMSIPAAYVYAKHNPFGDAHYDNTVIGQYLTRPKLAATYYDDILKCAFYFSSYILFESNKIGILRHFEKVGFESYLMTRPASTIGTHTHKTVSGEEYGVPSSQMVKQLGVELIANFLEESIDKIYFKELLQDLLIFDIMKTKVHDATMALIYTMIATTKIFKKPSEKKDLKDFLRTFRTS